MSNFIVFSLPRARSTWLSVFLSTGRSICYHDYSAYGKSLPKPRFAGEIVGMATTGAAQEWKHWRKKYPAAPLVVVRRDPEQCAVSFAAVMGGHANHYIGRMRDFDAALDQIAALPGTLSVAFEQIDEAAPKIFHHCLPGEPLDNARLHELLQIQMEPIPEKMRAEAARLAKLGWPRHD